jgi:hypothetical protein
MWDVWIDPFKFQSTSAYTTWIEQRRQERNARKEVDSQIIDRVDG